MHVLQRERKIRRSVPALTARYGREPTDEELASEVELPVHQVREVRGAARTVTSLDRPVGEDEGTSLGELFPSDEEEPVEEVDREVRERAVQRAVSLLPPPEREILRRRYGLTDDRRPQTVEQVVRSLGVSRAEVRQLEHCALERLAHTRELEAVREVSLK